MAKKVILIVVIVFIATAGVMLLILNGMKNTDKEMSARTEADFTTQRFVVNELWERQQKQNNTVLMSYLFIKVNNEPIKLRLPVEGAEGTEELASQLNKGDQIEVKVLKTQLQSARENGVLKAINRFIMDDKREVTIFKLAVNNKLLVDKDIHSWDDARVTLLNRVLDNPFMFLMPIFVIAIFIIGSVKRRNFKKQQDGKVVSNQ
jgi:hypothetical protein